MLLINFKTTGEVSLRGRETAGGKVCQERMQEEMARKLIGKSGGERGHYFLFTLACFLVPHHKVDIEREEKEKREFEEVHIKDSMP